MPAPGEPVWLPEDRDWARALLDVEAEACPDCGQPWAESSDPAAAHGARYEAELVRCHACAAGALAVKEHQKTGDSTALHVLIKKR